jgi:hypothetical protein
MMTTNWKQIFPYLLIACCCITLNVSHVKAEIEAPDGRVAVKADSATVFARMSENSEAVKTLKKGDLITVEFEIEGADGAWCGIVEEGRTTITGYIQCKYLEQRELQKMRWRPVGLSVGSADSNITKVTIVRNQVLVPVLLGYKEKTVEALLLLDTGASISVINTETADKLDINRAETTISAGQVVGGGLILIFIAKLNHITVGPHTKTGMQIGVVTHEGPPVRFDGLLGMDFLRDKKYSIDFNNQTVQWE